MIQIFRNPFLLKPLSIILALNVILLTSSFTFVPKKIKIPAGTLITLKLLDNISSIQCSEGDLVNLSVLYDVKKNDKKLIPAGTRAIGKVSLCNPAKGQGKPGEVGVDISSLRIGDVSIPLSSSPITMKGEDKSDLAWGVGIGACLLLAGIGIVAVFFIKGGEGELKAGKIIEGNVATDTSINL
tara:strand:+ start:1147 stop:1698 length:552 start_codon:yes stop_codon:yes gene_type:complete